MRKFKVSVSRDGKISDIEINADLVGIEDHNLVFWNADKVVAMFCYWTHWVEDLS
jgi:hypothetical protein